MSTYIETDITCPFYLDDHTRKKRISITCEGPKRYTKVELKFTCKESKLEHVDLYCECNYEECPVYKMTYQRYE